MKFLKQAGIALSLMLGATIGYTADSDAEAKIRDAMKDIAPGVTIDSITETPIKGVYEMMVGAEVMYISGDGRYLVRGQIYDMVTKTDIAEKKLAAGRLSVLDQFDEDKTIIYASKAPKHTVTVFTDIDCGYCRKLHRELADYNDAGISIQYMLYPRAGEGSESYKKAVSVWCSDNREEELTKAKMGGSLPDRKCEHPILEHMDAARKLGLRGTPMMVLENGEVISGYVPAAELSKRLIGL